MSRRLIVEADGGSRGNPGVAGYGSLVRDADTGALLAERAAPLGKASNNVAEYTGLIEGLKAVLNHEPDAFVTARMDSKLVVEQMSGRWKIKHQDMQRLAQEARDLVRQIEAAGGAVTYEWIPRAKNKDADKLSNDGMDGVTVRRDTWGEAADDESAAAEPDDEAKTDKAASASGPKSEAKAKAKTKAEVKQESKTGSQGEGKDEADKRVQPTRIVLVRHGVTDLTTSGRLDGRGGVDPDLSATGRAQADAAAHAVKALVGSGPVSVVTSSLKRAVSTGAAIAEALGVQPEVDADWDEQAFGEWDGLTFKEIEEKFPGSLLKVRNEPDYPAPGGESRSELDARVGQALDRAVARGGIVIVVSHRIAMMSVLARLLDLDVASGWKLLAAPASLTGVEVWPDGRSQIAFTNDTHHLR